MLFFKNKNITVEKSSRYFVGLIQVIFIQQLCKQAQKENLDINETGIFALLHGIVILYCNLENLKIERNIPESYIYRIKTLVIEHFAKAIYNKDNVPKENLESFIKWIYDLYDEISAKTYSEEEEIIIPVTNSLCNITGIKDKQFVIKTSKDLNNFISKYLRDKVIS